jgi:hypothetical protein
MPIPAKAAKYVMTSTGKMLKRAAPVVKKAVAKVKNVALKVADKVAEKKPLPQRVKSKYPDRTVKNYNKALAEGSLDGDIEPVEGTLPHIKEVLIKKFGEKKGLEKFESIKDFDNSRAAKGSPEFFAKLKRIMGTLPD